jgi:Lrp/AsnC family transcriptional regulator, leucine-responsive regulatory protein
MKYRKIYILEENHMDMVTKAMQLDAIDKKIITLFAKDSTISQDVIAKEVELTQPSVAVRIRKLREKGAIQTLTGINPLKMGLYIAKVDVTTNNSTPILEMFRECPYFAHGFTVSGKYNLCLFFMSENIAALEALVNNHLRSHGSVTDLNFNIIINSEKDFVIPTILTSGNPDFPPCGTHESCTDCSSFKNNRCDGCPAVSKYQGWLTDQHLKKS